MEPILRHAHSYITALMASGADLSSGLRRLTDYCRSAYPEETWDIVPDAAIADDLNCLYLWFNDILEAEPPTDGIVALWCGLYLTDYGYRLYLTGTEYFDRDDPKGDWIVSPAYQPGRRYAPPTTFLRSLSRPALCGRAAADLGEYVLVLGYACLIMTQVVSMSDPRLVVGGAGSRGFAVGFDDGDFVVLGTVTHLGLLPNLPPP
jgi:hypothetical protein